MNTSEIIFIGANAHVTAIQTSDGKLLWKTKLTGGLKLSGSDFVTLLVDGGRVFAYTYGTLYCLNASTGDKIFTRKVSGLKAGIATLVTSNHSSHTIESAAQQSITTMTDTGKTTAIID